MMKFLAWLGLFRQRVRIYRKVLKLFEGDHRQAMRWMDTPRGSLGGLAPYQANEGDVEALISQLEHGVFP